MLHVGISIYNCSADSSRAQAERILSTFLESLLTWRDEMPPPLKPPPSFKFWAITFACCFIDFLCNIREYSYSPTPFPFSFTNPSMNNKQGNCHGSDLSYWGLQRSMQSAPAWSQARHWPFSLEATTFCPLYGEVYQHHISMTAYELPCCLCINANDHNCCLATIQQHVANKIHYKLKMTPHTSPLQLNSVICTFDFC